MTLNAVWAGTEFKTYWVRREPYELAELAEVIPEGWRRPRVAQTASRPPRRRDFKRPHVPADPLA